MQRLTKTIAVCFTVLTTALPQGWCCWSPSSGSCCLQSAMASRPAEQAGLGACCHQSNRADTQVSTESGRSGIPLNSTPMECCQRAPISKPTASDYVAIPHLVALFAAVQISGTGTLAMPSASAQVFDPLSSSLRLHASLCRWRC